MKEFVNESHADYLSKKDFISCSALKEFKKSPLHYITYINNEYEREETKPMLIGTAIHTALQDKELFNEKYCYLKKEFLPNPDKDYRNKENKEFRDQFKENNKNKITLEEYDFDLIMNIIGKSEKDAVVKALIKDGHSEKSFYSIDEKTGLNIKMRVDFISEKLKIIVDYKTCQNSELKQFAKDIWNFGHYNQAAFYTKYIPNSNKDEKYEFINIALQKIPPYPITIVNYEQPYINYGMNENEMLLDLLKWCRDNNYYPDYTEFGYLKELYNNFLPLDDFWEVKNNRKRIEVVQLPYWIK